MVLESEAVETGSTIAGEDLCAGFNLYHSPVIYGGGFRRTAQSAFRTKIGENPLQPGTHLSSSS